MNTLGNNYNLRRLTKLAISAGSICLALAFGFSLMGGVVHAAPLAAPAPKQVSGFAVLAGTAVTCTDSTITGDVGVFPGTTITQTNCSITGNFHAGDGVAKQAYNDFLSAYAALAGVPCDTVLTGTLDGQTLAPGVYCFDAAAALTGTLTLQGPSNGTWIFKVGTLGTGALTATNFSVVMDGGVPCNVTWWVAQAATLTDSNFVGTILAGDAITITRGSFAGDAFAQAAVTMTGTSVVGCGGSGGNGGGSKCNQGVGNGPEGCDPGNSNQGNDLRSNDETGGTPGNPGRMGGNSQVRHALSKALIE